MPTNEVKLAFIEEELAWYGINVVDDIKARAREMGIGITDELVASVRYNVLSAASGDEGAMQLLFHEYGRMVDMGAGRGYKKSALAITNDDTIGKRTGRKPKPFYSKVAYGWLDRLIYRLSNNLTDEVITRLKATLESDAA